MGAQSTEVQGIAVNVSYLNPPVCKIRTHEIFIWYGYIWIKVRALVSINWAFIQILMVFSFILWLMLKTLIMSISVTSNLKAQEPHKSPKA